MSIFNYNHEKTGASIGGPNKATLMLSAPGASLFFFLCCGKRQNVGISNPFIPHSITLSDSEVMESLCSKQIVKAQSRHCWFSGSEANLTRPACFLSFFFFTPTVISVQPSAHFDPHCQQRLCCFGGNNERVVTG